MGVVAGLEMEGGIVDSGVELCDGGAEETGDGALAAAELIAKRFISSLSAS